MKLPSFHRRRVLASALLALTPALLATSAQAQANWPTHAGRIVVPYPAGGATDIMGRVAAEALAQGTGHRFVVDNKGGASGALGSAEVERAAPDGYTLLVATPATHVTNAFLKAKLAYDPDNFEPVVLLSRSPLVLIAHPSLPANSVAELVALAKREPGKLNYASSGTGATSHLAPELFKKLAEVDIAHIPYRGAGPAMTDLVGGKVQMMFDNLQSALPQIEAGHVKVLGVTSAERLASHPKVPAIGETVKGYEALSFLALVAPKGTPRPTIDVISRQIQTHLKAPALAATLAGIGVEPVESTPESLATFLRGERAKWGALIKERGLTAE